jgi:hypothetical protein
MNLKDVPIFYKVFTLSYLIHCYLLSVSQSSSLPVELLADIEVSVAVLFFIRVRLLASRLNPQPGVPGCSS